MSISARRKSVFETRPTGSKIRQTQRHPVKTAMLRVPPFRVNTAELARRKFLHLAAGAATLPTLWRSAEAQAYPMRPITIVVPFAAGGALDMLARFTAERMRAPLAQPVIIENVSGAGGSIGVGRVARAAPDGYTLVAGTWSTHVVNAAIQALAYDVLDDFAPILLMVNNVQIIVARKTLPANDLKSVIAWLKANPDTAVAGTAGVGSLLHVDGVFFLTFRAETRWLCSVLSTIRSTGPVSDAANVQNHDVGTGHRRREFYTIKR